MSDELLARVKQAQANIDHNFKYVDPDSLFWCLLGQHKARERDRAEWNRNACHKCKNKQKREETQRANQLRAENPENVIECMGYDSTKPHLVLMSDLPKGKVVRRCKACEAERVRDVRKRGTIGVERQKIKERAVQRARRRLVEKYPEEYQQYFHEERIKAAKEVGLENDPKMMELISRGEKVAKRSATSKTKKRTKANGATGSVRKATTATTRSKTKERGAK